MKALLHQRGNHKSWDEYVLHIEFEYNRVINKTTNISPFEVMYGFNPLTHSDLLPLPNRQEFVQKEGIKKSKYVKKMYERCTYQSSDIDARDRHRTSRTEGEIGRRWFEQLYWAM